MQINAHPTENGKYNIQYCINGDSIKSEVIDEKEKEIISLHMGKPLNAASSNEAMTSIDHYKIDTEELIKTVSDEDFSGSGVK